MKILHIVTAFEVNHISQCNHKFIMKEITYNKKDIERSVNYFNEYTEEDKDCGLYYLGEELKEKMRDIDHFLSNTNGFYGNKFNSKDKEHVLIFAKLQCINEAINDITDDIELYEALEIENTELYKSLKPSL